MKFSTKLKIKYICVIAIFLTLLFCLVEYKRKYEDIQKKLSSSKINKFKNIENVYDSSNRYIKMQEEYYQDKILLRKKFIETENIANGGVYTQFPRMQVVFEPFQQCLYGSQLIGTQLGDGGKQVCGIFSLSLRDEKKNPPCIVYSFGSAESAIFEEEIRTRTSCSIHIFDATSNPIKNYELNVQNKKYSYHSLLIKAKSIINTDKSKQEYSSISIPDIMKKFNHSYIDIMKMDIESSEYEIFDSFMEMKKNGIELPKIGQIQLEVHSPKFENLNKLMNFFEENGQRLFSRDVNLISTHCCEYSFVHKDQHPIYGFSLAK